MDSLHEDLARKVLPLFIEKSTGFLNVHSFAAAVVTHEGHRSGGFTATTVSQLPCGTREAQVTSNLLTIYPGTFPRISQVAV